MSEPVNQTDPVESRRMEVAQYDANIAMYKAILDTLPSEWPSRLEIHRYPTNQHDEATQIDDLGDLELVSQLWYSDDVRRAIRTETVERTKAAAILAAMESMET